MAIEIEAPQPVGDRRALAGRVGVPGADRRFVIEQIDRAFDKDRARHAGAGDGEGFDNRRREVAHAPHPLRPFDEGRDHRPLVDVLQRAAPLERGRRGAADQQERRLREPRVFERGQRIGDAGAGGDRRHARPAGQSRDGVGGEDRGRLVAHIDDANAAGLGGDENGRDVAAAQREEKAHALRLQGRGDTVAAMGGAASRGAGRGRFHGHIHPPILADPGRRCRLAHRGGAAPGPERDRRAGGA